MKQNQYNQQQQQQRHTVENRDSSTVNFVNAILHTDAVYLCM